MLARLSACLTTDDDTISGGEGPVRSDASNKHVIRIDVRGPPFQIAEHRIADILPEAVAVPGIVLSLSLAACRHSSRCP